jgi:hypothetical protein
MNLDGPFLVTHNLLPLLKESQAGRIIFFSSASIYAGMPEQCPDVAAKAGLIGFTRSHGPDVLSGPGVAAIWSKVLGEEVRYQGHDMEAFEAQMREQAPAWSASDIRMMMQGYLEGRVHGESGRPGNLDCLDRASAAALRGFRTGNRRQMGQGFALILDKIAENSDRSRTTNLSPAQWQPPLPHP